MEEVSITRLIGRYDLVVPEIQREYVWGNNEYEILDIFLSDIKEGRNNISRTFNMDTKIQTLLELAKSADDNTRNVLLESVETLKSDSIKNNSINIGFLYSYKPSYYINNDRDEDVYLIDGQQRFTTLFLILFYFGLKENRLNDFLDLFRFNSSLEKIAFDYRVRTLTHHFIIDLLSYTQTLEDLLELKDKNWFLANYQNDVTVQSIVGYSEDKSRRGAFPIIHQHFKDDKTNYFDFVKDNIKFWHFKTEESSQGEELYITMNSRGQELADNETIRAKLFEPLSPKEAIEWSEKWEEWQDFFWKRRNKKSLNSSADNGFNEFLRWVQIIKMSVRLDKEKKEALSENSIEDVIQWDTVKKLDVNYLSLQEIYLYYKVLCYLFEDFNLDVELLKSKYSGYSNFDLLKTDCLSPTKGTISQIECFQLLPVLHYCSRVLEANEKINAPNLFRLIRFFFNLSRDTTIKKSARKLTINAIEIVDKLAVNADVSDIIGLTDEVSKTILDSEEKIKFEKYKTSSKRRELEALFWEAEDIKQVEGKINHLIEFVNNSTTSDADFLPSFKKNLDSYKELIHSEEEIWGDLLPTGVYHENEHRVYYDQKWYKSDDFLSFTEDRKLAKGLTLDEFLIHKRKDFIKQRYLNADNLRAETTLKYQLYLYYILHQNILNQWRWNGRNFGVYYQEEVPDAVSLFNNNRIYQYYKTRWRRGHTNGIWLQDHYIPKTKYFGRLITWASK